MVLVTRRYCILGCTQKCHVHLMSLVIVNYIARQSVHVLNWKLYGCVSLWRNLVTDPKVRLKYQQLITNSFVEVHHVFCFVAFVLLLEELSNIPYVLCIPKCVVKFLSLTTPRFHDSPPTDNIWTVITVCNMKELISGSLCTVLHCYQLMSPMHCLF